MDGHNMEEILATLQKAQAHRTGPVAIVAHTVKGQGISYMENNYKWHARVPDDEELAIAMSELGEPSPGGAS